ncbi:hypothetical protein CU097_007844 [Rhizopus azygosporus]|uniref:GDP/GTP exchange factor Sec2 N-terminal domain-containing protein n=1 Tax=Rhizopus azygosporus TaxID=86630 RepID=A0A367JES3_RHIAZ|nr:hypothetical protein CU097_007844 [Rhizopus azygosporus]
MSWRSVDHLQHNPIIIIDPILDGTKDVGTKPLSSPVLVMPPATYDSPLLSTPSFSSSVSTLSSCQSAQTDFFDATLVQSQARQIEELRKDLTVLNEKYIWQIEKLQSAEQQTAEIEHELEDLSQHLFEQANAMHSKCTEFLDREWQRLFMEFIEATPRTPIDLLHRLPFLKSCTVMDTQPCLRSCSRLPKYIIKRLLDSAIHQPCLIETATSFQKQHQQLTGRSSFASIFRPGSSSQCYGCGSKIDKEGELYRFKLKEMDTEWQYIDLACRNRLVAVCNFYAFIRHIYLGLRATKSIDSLFEECFQLRLSMFYARSGVNIYN